jgi:hypothetical protein
MGTQRVNVLMRKKISTDTTNPALIAHTL